MLLWNWRTIRAWVSAGAGAAAAVATTYLIWAQLNREYRNTQLEIVCLAAVLTVTLIAACGPLVRVYTIDRYAKHRDRVALMLRALNWTVHEHTNGAVPVQPLGASAWVVRRRLVPFRQKRLYRLAHERVHDTPGPSNIRWTKGKGVIGRVWETGQVECVDTGKFDAKYGNHTEAQWDRLKPETRRHLSFKEYVQIRGKYGTVVAVPMIDRSDRRLVGVVALDAPEGSYAYLQAQRIIQTIGRSAATIGSLIT